MKNNRHKLLTFTVLMTTATGIIHLTNKLISATAQLKEMLDISNRNFYEWRLGKIYYTKKGKGTPILLIHDTLPGASGYEWTRIEKELSMEHTVYTIDLLGCGRSEKPGITYANFVFVQLICDFINDIIGEKTDIIASGYSGSFVTMACLHENDCIDKVILVNPPSIHSLKQSPTEKDKLLKFFIEIPVFGTLIYHMIVSRETISDLFLEKFYYNPFHLEQDIVDAYYESSHKGGAYAKHLYSSLTAKYLNIDISRSLESINNSIYIVTGDAEPNESSTVDEYCKLNPSIETVSIKKTKHFPHLEDPEKFLEQVGIFF